MNGGSMTVLQVNKFGWAKGGSEAAYLGTMSLLERNGHTVIPFTMKDERNPPSEFSKYFVENVSYDNGGLAAKAGAAMKVVYSLDARRKMGALLGEIRPDIAHLHNFHHQISPSVFGPLKSAGVPFVFTVHDLKPMCPNYKMLVNGELCERCKGGRFYNCIINRCIKGSSAKSLVGTVEMYFHRLMRYYEDVELFITPSTFMRDKMVEYGFTEDRIKVIPNFIDLNAFRTSASDAGYVLYCGRLSGEKGVSTLLDAAGICREISFVIAGTGPLDESFRARVAALGMDNVKFAGHQAGEHLIRLYTGARVTAVPSECYENCPVSLLESFASGKPVVGARIGGIPELIEEGVDGVTFMPGDPYDLADKLRQVWGADVDAREKMGGAARRKAVTRHSPEKYYESLMKAYDTALHQGKANEKYS